MVLPTIPVITLFILITIIISVLMKQNILNNVPGIPAIFFVIGGRVDTD